MVNAELQSLRTDIDEIDAEIVHLLADRFRITAKIGKLKAANGLGAVDPHREAAQEARFRELAKANGLNPALVVQVFRAVIDEVVTNHRKA